MRARFYAVAAAWLLRSEQPVLIEEVHPEAKKNGRKVQAAFLKRLQVSLPPAVRPIVITDAGFQNPRFREVEAIGWHWVGRVRPGRRPPLRHLRLLTPARQRQRRLQLHLRLRRDDLLALRRVAAEILDKSK